MTEKERRIESQLLPGQGTRWSIGVLTEVGEADGSRGAEVNSAPAVLWLSASHSLHVGAHCW